MFITIKRKLSGKLSDIAAWLDETEGCELVDVRGSSLPVKLLSMIQAQLGWLQGRAQVQKNTPRLIEIGNALGRSIFAEPCDLPPPAQGNTLAIIAAYINSDLKLHGILNNIEKIKPYCDKIIVVDLAENLTAATTARILAAHDNIKTMVKSNSDLLDMEAWRVGLADDWVTSADYFLLINDSFFIYKDLQAFFAMAIQDQGQHDRYGILEGYNILPYIQTHITLLNRRAKDFFVSYVEQTAPLAVALLDKKRKSAKPYYEFYRKSIGSYAYECGLTRHIKSCALFSYRQDRRLRGINLYYHDAALFRDYMDKGFPLFHWKQLKRRALRPLIAGYLPGRKS